MAELTISRRLSKDPEEYNHNLLQAITAKRLTNEGMRIHAGGTVQYLIRDADNPNPHLRATPLQLLDSGAHHDAKEYLKLLIDAADTVLEPFNLTNEEITTALHEQKQVSLRGAPRESRPYLYQDVS